MILSNDFLDQEDPYTGELKCRHCGKWRDKGEDCPCLKIREEAADEKMERIREKGRD